MTPNVSTITDISANIFSVLLVLLIAMMAVHQRPRQASPDVEVNVERDLFSIARKPLAASEMVGLLFDRRDDSGTSKIDLLEADAIIADDGRVRRVGFADFAARPLALGLPANEIVLYVFDHRGYRAVTEALMRQGRRWKEISVPEALRRPDPATGKPGWAPEFTALLGRGLDRTGFQIELARLLGANRPGRTAAAPQPPDHRGAHREHSGGFLSEGLPRWREGVGLLAFFMGLGLVACTEVGFVRHRRRALRDGASVSARSAGVNLRP